MPVTTAFTDANAFLDALSPRRLSGGASRGRFIYRGQSDARWQLLPTALRDGVSLPIPHLGWQTVDWTKQTIASQRHGELAAAKDFFTHADRQGLAFPENGQALRKRLQDAWLIGSEDLPSWPRRTS